jgi:hypothetical protein
MHDKTDFEICRFQTRTFVASCDRTSDESGFRNRPDTESHSPRWLWKVRSAPGSGSGVPVPRRTICVLEAALFCAWETQCHVKRNRSVNARAPHLRPVAIIRNSSLSARPKIPHSRTLSNLIFVFSLREGQVFDHFDYEQMFFGSVKKLLLP